MSFTIQRLQDPTHRSSSRLRQPNNTVSHLASGNKLEKRLVRQELRSELEKAIHNQTFDVYYQPIVSTNDGHIVSAEALVRWNNPSRGALTPNSFIPLAEDTGLIVPLDRFVLHTACAQIVAWEACGVAPLRIAVNISSRTLRDPQFIPSLQTIIQQTGINPASLGLEITESLAVSDDPQTQQVIERIKALGIELAIDDFGTGYSVLNRLREFPFQLLKIDGSFTREMTKSQQGATLVQAMIQMAHSLGVAVAAEGVETVQQAYMLREYGCDFTQGFLVSPAVTAVAFATLYKQRAPVDAQAAAYAATAPLLAQLAGNGKRTTLHSP